MSKKCERIVRKTHHFSFVCVMFTMLCIGVVSCGDDEDEELAIPSASFDMKFSSFTVSNGDFLSITPTVNTSKSSSGLVIRRVQYYWDNLLVSTELSAPFELNYKIQDQKIGKHTITIKVVYGGEGYKEMETTDGFKFEVNVVEKLTVAMNPVFSPGREIKNGEVFRCEAKLDEEKTTVNVRISKVVFLWDDITMAEITQSPFTFEHTFTNETVGAHKLTLHYFVVGDITTDAYFSYDITIK